MIKFPKIQATPFSKHIAGAWYRLVNKLRKYAEHWPFTNGEGDALADGELLYISGNRTCSRAADDTIPESRVCGVCCEPTASGEQGVMRTQGLAMVLFEPGLDPAPAAGNLAFVGTVPGRGSNAGATAITYTFGTIEDASNYDPVTGGHCYVNINRCCIPIRGGE